MTTDWTAETIARLTDYSLCPRCSSRTLQSGSCGTCRADLSGTIGAEIASSSLAVVAALEARQAAVDRIPTLNAAALPVAASPAPASPAAVSETAPAVLRTPPPALRHPAIGTPPRASSQLSIQSVLAVAGAGLFAVAAIVFTFSTPDLTETARTTIVAITTALFIVGALLLARAGLQFSAETVGALGMVFVALDVWAFARHGVAQLDPWTAAAFATLVAAAIVVGIGLLARVRTWLWAGLVALTLVPAFLFYDGDDAWWSIIGHLGVALVAIGVTLGLPAAGRRLGSPLRVDRGTMTALQLLAVAVVLVQLVALAPPAPLDRALSTSAVLIGIAVISALATIGRLRGMWSVLTGVFAAAGAAAIPLSPLVVDPSSVWIGALVPLCATVAVIILAIVVQPGGSGTRGWSRVRVLTGAWAVFLLTTSGAVILALGQLTVARSFVVYDTTTGPVVMAGLASAVVVGIVLRVLAPRIGAAKLARLALTVAAWYAIGVLLAFTSWRALLLGVQVGSGVAIAVALTMLALRAPIPLRFRLPVLVGSHILLIHAIIQSAADPLVHAVGGGAIVAAIVLLSRAVVVGARPIYIGSAFAYALVLLGTTLNDTTALSDLLIVALVASVAALASIAATLIGRLRVGYWYAILIVSAVPFVLSVAAVLFERSGWTAIPATAVAILASIVIATRRHGMTILLRTIAAISIVPALAVIVVCLGAAGLAGSGSPVVLPVVAAIVAVIFPATLAISKWLQLRGVGEQDARLTRLALEWSSLATAAIAVLLALLRVAAGFETSFLVLAIVGLGGAATAVFSDRRYGWTITYISWTGALWSLFALWGVTVLEPYVLPPAIVAVIIGVVGVLRGRDAVRLFTVGLVAAALPSLVQLVTGNPDGPATVWRLWALMGASIVLIVMAIVSSRFTRIVRLRIVMLAVAVLAAAAPAVNGAVTGLRLPPTVLSTTSTEIIPVLGVAALAAVLSATALRLIGSASRLTYMIPLIYLIIVPTVAVRHDWVSIWTLYALMAALLVALVVTTAIARHRATALPPVWFLFAIAWIVGVASWSQRELRVDAYSLPMGAALLAAGVIAWRSSAPARSLTSWPIGFAGSWALLLPGLFVTFAPSILSTATDPQTWRAVLVIVLALASILIGSRLKLAAPFLVGIAVLPLENVVVFAVQSSRGIESTPWWITLASAGAVLLVIAVTSERRTTGGGIAARIRDLR